MSHTATVDLLDGGYIAEPDLAKKWKVNERTLRRYRSEPNGLPYLVLGGCIYYRITSVIGWLEARERRPNPRRVAA